MSTEVSVFILCSVIQVILAQRGPPVRTPQECLKGPKIMNYADCCPLPPMYSENELQRCNYDPNVPPYLNIEEDCNKKICLLRNRGLLLSDDNIDYEKLRTSVEHWAINRTHLRKGLDIAKQICFTNEFEEEEQTGNPICESDRIFHCLTGHLVWNCELNLDYPGCDRLQLHLDRCRKYLYIEPY